MRRLPALVLALVAAVAAVAAVLGPVPAAHAGGPTSVLVTQPGVGAAALYHTDSRYGSLEELVTAGGDEVPAPSSLGNGGQAFNVTWLIHDQLVWRTDRVHVADGRVYVETTLADGVMDPASAGTTTWRRADKGEALLGLLRGLVGPGGTTDGGRAEKASDVAVPARPEAPAEASSRAGTSTGWWWVLPGLLAGAAGGVLAGRRRERDRGPRQVLLDREPSRA